MGGKDASCCTPPLCRGWGTGDGGGINRLCLLCIGLFQQRAPVLVLSERFGEHQLVVAGGDAVVHDHIDPFAITPELKTGHTEQ